MFKNEFNLERIKEAIRANQIRISDHADEEARADNLTINEILLCVQQGEIIEHYPRDRPYPSCLVLSKTNEQEPIHSVWAYNAKNEWAVLITVYRPNPKLWIEWKIRSK